MLRQTNRIIHRSPYTLQPLHPFAPYTLQTYSNKTMENKSRKIITDLPPNILKINNNKSGQEIGVMLFKLVGTVLLLASLSWSSVFCPEDIQAKTKSAIEGELITEGEALKGFRVFIRNKVGRARIVVPLEQVKTSLSTTWDNYTELLYVLSEGELPKVRFRVKVLAGGKTYICTVSIDYNFYSGLVVEVE